MDKLPGLLITLVVIALAFWLMARSWRRRVRRDAGLQLGEANLELAETLWQGSVGYIASTPAEQPLERLTPAGLAYRGNAELTVATNGLRLQVTGEAPVLAAAARLRGAREAAWAIDRGVGPGGLVALSWLSANPEPTAVDSYLRVQDHARRAELIAAIHQISPSTQLASSIIPTENA